MSPESRKVAGIVFVLLPAVIYGGICILTQLIGNPDYMANPLRQDLWRAGHAHAGVLLILSLVACFYVDQARLSARLKAWGSDSDSGVGGPLSGSVLPFSSVARRARTERVNQPSVPRCALPCVRGPHPGGRPVALRRRPESRYES